MKMTASEAEPKGSAAMFLLHQEERLLLLGKCVFQM